MNNLEILLNKILSKQDLILKNQDKIVAKLEVLEESFNKLPEGSAISPRLSYILSNIEKEVASLKDESKL